MVNSTVLRTCFCGPGARLQHPKSRHLFLGSNNQDPDACNQNQKSGTCDPDTRIAGTGSWILAPGARLQNATGRGEMLRQGLDKKETLMEPNQITI